VTCDEIRDLLPPYADGELDLLRGVEIERHLQQCPACAAALEQTRALSAQLRDPGLYYQPPADLHRRIRDSLSRRAPGPGRLAFWPWRRLGAIAAAAALVLVAVWGAVRGLAVPSATDLLAQEVIACHVRSIMLTSHTFDVVSGDQHTVKPWFIGKVDVVPDAKNLSQEGFTLEGGRLDYVGGHPAATLVYSRNRHIINVFIWRAPGPDLRPQYLERQGYHLIHWSDNDRAFWVVSDLNARELREFAELLRR
jgi:anti-sigma factor RsiW